MVQYTYAIIKTLTSLGGNSIIKGRYISLARYIKRYLTVDIGPIIPSWLMFLNSEFFLRQTV